MNDAIPLKSSSDLPATWAEASLDGLGAWFGGGTPSKDSSSYWNGGSIPWVSPKDMKIARILDTEDHITEQAVRNSAASLVPGGAVLMVTRSGILRHTFPVATAGTDLTLNQDMKALVLFDGLHSEYIAAALRAFGDEVLSQCAKHGTTVQSIELSRLKDFQIPIAPLNEQQRIVAKIDELFSELDAGVASLKRAKALLRKYRQAVLKAAFTGELTRDWRERHQGQIEESGADLLRRILKERRETWQAAELKKLRANGKPPKDQPTFSEEDLWGFPALPDGWTWAPLGNLVSDGPTNGYSPKSDHNAKGTLSLRLSATTQGHLLLMADTIKHLHENVPPESKYWLEPGDVLVQRANSLEYVGATAIFEGPRNKYIYPDLMIRIRFESPMLRLFVWRYLNCRLARDYFKSKATGTAGNMPKINAEILRRLPVPLPSMEELNAIEERVAETFVIVDHFERDLAGEDMKPQALRQSILKAAFAGKLVPQDPNDEPASVLLERIRAERAARPKPARGRRRKAGLEAGAARMSADRAGSRRQGHGDCRQG